MYFNAIPIDKLARYRFTGIGFDQMFMAVTAMLRTSFEQDIAAMTRVLRIQDYEATPWPTRLGAAARRFLPSVRAVAQHLRLLARVEDQPRQSSCLSLFQLITISLHSFVWGPIFRNRGEICGIEKLQTTTNHVAFTGLQKDIVKITHAYHWHRVPYKSMGIEVQISIFFNAVPVDELARYRFAGEGFDQIFMAVTNSHWRTQQV